jgi:hypothetical protein
VHRGEQAAGRQATAQHCAECFNLLDVHVLWVLSVLRDGFSLAEYTRCTCILQVQLISRPGQHQHCSAEGAVDAHLRSTYVSALNLLTVFTSTPADLGVTTLTAAHDMSAHRLQTRRAFATSVLLLLGSEQRCPRITCRAAAGSTEMLVIRRSQWKSIRVAIAQRHRSVELHRQRDVV